MRQKRSKNKGSIGTTLAKYVVLGVAGGVLAISIGYFATQYFILPKVANSSLDDNEIIIEKPIDNNNNKVVNNSPATDGDNANNNVPEATDNTATNTPVVEPPTTTNNNQATNNTPSTPAKYNIELPALTVYNVQVGSFNNEVHAKKMVDDLHAKKLGGYIVATDRYRVSTLALASREGANNYKNTITDSYSDAFIAVVNVPVRNIGYNEGTNEINIAINSNVKELNTYLKRLSSFVANNLNNATKDELNTYIDKELAFLTKIQAGLNLITPTDSNLAGAHSDIKKIIDDSVTKFKSARANSEKDVAIIHEILLLGMNGYAMVNN